ncbi:MAG: methionine sulfoxide reductase [Negativicutes bacterium]|nr:methionine sulfoxide reductase [Negativicutes bacterium]
MKELYLSGGPYYILQEVFSRLNGVTEAKAGFAETPTDCLAKDSAGLSKKNYIECVKIIYNPKKIDITNILKLYFKIVDPYSLDRQGKYEGLCYRPCVYYTQGEDLVQIEYYFRFMQMKGKEPTASLSDVIVNDTMKKNGEMRKWQAEYKKLVSFKEASENEQFYLRKNPGNEVSVYVDFKALEDEGSIKKV